MKCMFCTAEMKRGTAPVHIDRDTCHVTLHSVPAWICPQCGEFYFEENEVNKIQEVIQSLDEKTAEMKMSAC